MNKQMAIGLIALILFSGVSVGYLIGQYSLKAQLSQSEALAQNACTKCVDMDGPTECSTLCKRSQGNCISLCGGTWGPAAQ